MFTRTEFKLEAKEKLRGNWVYLAGLTLIIMILTMIANLFGEILIIIGLILMMFITIPLEFSTIIISIKLYKEEEIPVNSIFDGFNFTVKAVGLSLWMSLWVFLWALLLFIPGIIKAYSYSMAYICLINNPDLTIREALKESIRITNGYKADLFILDLSWIGWGLLSVATCGIGVLFLTPYQAETKYIAFRFMKYEHDNYLNQEEDRKDEEEVSTRKEETISE